MTVLLHVQRIIEWIYELRSINDDSHVLKLVRSVSLESSEPLVFKQRWFVEGSALQVENTLERNAGMPLPRVGLKAQINDADSVNWYGYGPGEAYSDRRSSAQLGLFKADKTELFETSYLKPQENGHRLDVRYMAIAGLAITSNEPFGFNVQPYDTTTLEDTKHIYELPSEKKVCLYLDHQHAGLGNRSCGPETASKYKLTEKTYQWSLRFDLVEDEERFQERWRWPHAMPHAKLYSREQLMFKEDRSDFREKISSRVDNVAYRDPSDADVRNV